MHDFRGREDALSAAKCQWLADLKRHVQRHMFRGRKSELARVYLERGRPRKIHLVFVARLNLSIYFQLFFILSGGPEFLRHTCNKNLDQSRWYSLGAVMKWVR